MTESLARLAIAAVPVVTSVVCSIVSWRLAAARTAARLEEDLRDVERERDAAVARHGELAERMTEAFAWMDRTLRARLDESLAAGLEQCAKHLQNSPALRKVQQTVEASGDRAIRRILESVAAIDKRVSEVGESVSSLEELLGRELRQGALARIDDALGRISSLVGATQREIKGTLMTRLSAVGLGVERSREAIEAFRWEALRRGKPPPWEAE